MFEAPLPWFRFPWRFAMDRRIQDLPFAEQRHFVMLLCWAAEGSLRDTKPSAIHQLLGTKPVRNQYLLSLFEKRGLIKITGDLIEIVDWESYQKPYDISTSRSNKSKQRKKALLQKSEVEGTLRERSRNVVDLDLDLELKEKNKKESTTNPVDDNIDHRWDPPPFVPDLTPEQKASMRKYFNQEKRTDEK